MPDISFPVRLLVLVSVFSLIALFDWFKHRTNATRWREYLFISATGICGAVIGVLNDLVTSRICREYFTDFKGIPDNANFEWNVLVLGCHAGLFAGIVVGVFLLFANTTGKLPKVPYSVLGKLVAFPFVGAIVFALLVGVSYTTFRPGFVSETAEGVIPASRLSAFALVWGVHTGLYAGALLGELIACALVFFKRKKS